MAHVNKRWTQSGFLALIGAISLLAALGAGGCDTDTAGGGSQHLGEDAACSGPTCADASTDVGAGDDITATPSDVGDDGGDDGGDDDQDAADSGPSCAPENRCAQSCCTADQLCLRDSCVVPGADCAVNQECGDDQICEPTLGKCIPDPGVVCEYRPPTQVFDPAVELAWQESDDTPAADYHQVMMTPSVIDINQNGSPDIVFSTFRGSNYNGESVLRAIDGETNEPIFDLTDADKRVSGSASVAIGDIDGDQKNEIVAVQPSSAGLIAFDDYTTNWAIMWQTTGFDMHWDGASLVDLDADGQVEIVAANRVFEPTNGQQLCQGSGLSGNPHNSAAVDLDGDGRQEVIVNNGAFSFEDDGDGGYACQRMWQYESGGGFPAVGDFGTFTDDQQLFGQLDGLPEVVTVNTSSSNQVTLSNAQTGATIWTATLPTSGPGSPFSVADCTDKNGAGPPTIADFDGDGAPEVATAGACFYVVFDTDGSLLWKHPSQDFSSRITGSSVFDFQGDGKAEVVYADECFVRVYDGAGNGDGTTDVLFKRSHTSGTTRELPVVVDVDRDYHADIVVISNDYSGAGDRCTQNWPEFTELGGPEHGILTISDAENRWVSTRPVWNQYSYHVTNVCDGDSDRLCPGRPNTPGAIPVGQVDNWSEPYLNNFRQNVQGDGLFNAPDLQITNIKTVCDGQGLNLRLTVANRGTRGVRAGVDIGVWVTVDGTETFLTSLTTTQDLPPGGRETLEYDWTDAPDPSGQTISVRAVADTNEAGDNQHNECHEDNNETLSTATCTCQSNVDCDPREYCTADHHCERVGG